MVTHREAAGQAMVEAVYYAYSCAVDGDIAEFGTMSGYTAFHLAQAMNIYEARKGHWIAEKKRLYLFDSFQGLPEAHGIDLESPHVQSGVWGENTCVGYSANELRALCQKHIDRVTVIQGWFKDTVKTFRNYLSVVHIDSDLYQSAIDVLDPLFAKRLITDGCMILFDDWNCNRASPEFGERRAWAEIVKKYNVEYSDAGAYGFMSHKFIVHGYAA